MSIRKPILAILAVSALSAMTQIAFADDDRHECTPKITSSTIAQIAQNVGGWVISGHCLEEVTNVSLAKDDGMGYENIPFSTGPNPSLKTSLMVPFVPRTNFINAAPIAQYLLQVKRCKNVVTGDKCTTFDEKFVFVINGGL